MPFTRCDGMMIAFFSVIVCGGAMLRVLFNN